MHENNFIYDKTSFVSKQFCFWEKNSKQTVNHPSRRTIIERAKLLVKTIVGRGITLSKLYLEPHYIT